MMKKRISLPSDSQVMGTPAIAVIAVTQTALAMTASALRCEHINLDELHLYLAGEKRSKKSDWIAYDICLRHHRCRRKALRSAQRISNDGQHGNSKNEKRRRPTFLNVLPFGFPNLVYLSSSKYRHSFLGFEGRLTGTIFGVLAVGYF